MRLKSMIAHRINEAPLDVLASLASNSEPPSPTYSVSSLDDISSRIKTETDHDISSAAERRRARLSKIRAQKRHTNINNGPVHIANTPESSAMRVEIEMSTEIQEDDLKKKQERMIRNRQSAALSRKRKADRISSLEKRVAFLEEENKSLRSQITFGSHEFKRTNNLAHIQSQCSNHGSAVFDNRGIVSCTSLTISRQ